VGKSCTDEVFTNKPAKDVAARVRELLKANPAQPVGMSFCASVFSHDASFRGIERTKGDIAKDCGAHGALIIGQRRDPNTKKCQFMVRNSWGGTCAHYNWCIEKPEKGPDGLLHCKQEGWPCKPGEGNIWVDAEALSNNIFGLQYVK
jgi:hypothetical protein